MGDSFLSQFSDGICMGANASISHTTQLRPMTTQTQATDQALTVEQLEALNGGDAMGQAAYIAGTMSTLGVFALVDGLTGWHLQKDAFAHY